MATAQMDPTPSRVDADTKRFSQLLYAQLTMHQGDLSIKMLTEMVQLSLNEALLLMVPALPVPNITELQAYLRLHEKKVNGRGVNPLTAPRRKASSPSHDVPDLAQPKPKKPRAPKGAIAIE
jgi:hypothetical protein